MKLELSIQDTLYVFKLYIFMTFFLSQYIYWYYKDINLSLEFIKSQMITNQI